MKVVNQSKLKIIYKKYQYKIITGNQKIGLQLMRLKKNYLNFIVLKKKILKLFRKDEYIYYI
jgi:hypothetical protein